MRGGSRLAACSAAAALALGSAACTGGGTPAASPSPAPPFTAAIAPGFSARPAWSDTLTWSVSVNAASGAMSDPDLLLMALQAQAGYVRVVGSSVVAATFARGQISSGATAGLQFRSLRTGALLATVHLPPGTFAGVAVDSAAGRPVAVVRYTSAAPADEQANGGQPVKVTAVYGADGSPVWTSLGRAVASGPADSSGLATDGEGYPLYSAGFTLRYNGSQDANPAEQSFDVLGPAGSVALHVPRQADASGDQAHVSLADGYALVSYDNRNAIVDNSAIRVLLAAYGLGRGSARVGAWSEPGSSADGERATLLAVAGGRLLVDWLGPGGGPSAPTDFAVLDTATGSATAASGVPAAAASPGALGAVSDPATGNVLVYDAAAMTGPSFLIHLASGSVAWAQDGTQASLQPISVHDGQIYALLPARAAGQASLATVRETDGAITARGYRSAPLGFTGDGAAVFAQSTSPTALTAVRIGVSAPADGHG